MRATRFAVAMTLLVALEPVLGASRTVEKPATPPIAEADCWVEHAQVQPSPARQGLAGKHMASPKYRLLAEEHVGSQHPRAKRMPPCNSGRPHANPGDRATAAPPR